MPSRSLAAALIAVAVLSGAMAGTTVAAFQIVTLSAVAAPAGTEVTVRVEISGRTGTSPRSNLVLVAQDAYEAAPDSQRCEQLPGAQSVGELVWHEDTIAFQGQSYAGLVAEATFVVPGVDPGHYYLAEKADSRGTGCHVFGEFEVTRGSLPDTALAPPRIP